MIAAYCCRSTGVPDWLCAYATIRVRFPIHRSLPIHDEWRKATLQPGHREGGSGHISEIDRSLKVTRRVASLKRLPSHSSQRTNTSGRKCNPLG